MELNKTLYFDGIDMSDYGVYITGEAVFNAPQRRVEYVEIPGRSGDYAIDQGSFQNIEVTYPAGLFDYDAATFAERISEVRNLLASRIGYVRISDDYNPGEYRMGIFDGGLEVSPAAGNTAGEFEIMFNCKPQRFLTSGEQAVTLDDGDVITNPTAFESKPIIVFDGYGSMDINGYNVKLNSEPLGEVMLANGDALYNSINTKSFLAELLNAGDPITMESTVVRYDYFAYPKAIGIVTYTQTGDLDVNVVPNYIAGASKTIIIYLFIGEFSCVKGTTKTESVQVTYTITFTDYTSLTVTISISCKYENDTMTFTCASSYQNPEQRFRYKFGTIKGISSKSALGNPVYVDCEIGDCYKYEDGTIVFINKYVELPDGLPELSSGDNTVTFDNTITQLDIIPRWWKV